MKRWIWSLALCSALLSTPSHAQNVLQRLKDLAEATRQGQTAPAHSGTGGAAGGTGNERLSSFDGPPIWPSRREFLADVESGRLLGLGYRNPGAGINRDRFDSAIFHLLQAEFAGQPITDDCYLAFRSVAGRLFASITDDQLTMLGNDAPEFTNAQDRSSNRTSYERDGRELQRRLNELTNPSGPAINCETAVMGRINLHPYRGALGSLTTDFTRATQMAVEQERNRRKQAYQAELARQQQAQAAEQQRQAEDRAAEQQRINTEAARIREEEARRAARAKSRVGG